MPLLIIICFFSFAGLAHVIGQENENKRLYDKCLVEQQDKSHKDAIELCKERVK